MRGYAFCHNLVTTVLFLYVLILHNFRHGGGQGGHILVDISICGDGEIRMAHDGFDVFLRNFCGREPGAACVPGRVRSKVIWESQGSYTGVPYLVSERIFVVRFPVPFWIKNTFTGGIPTLNNWLNLRMHRDNAVFTGLCFKTSG